MPWICNLKRSMKRYYNRPAKFIFLHLYLSCFLLIIPEDNEYSKKWSSFAQKLVLVNKISIVVKRFLFVRTNGEWYIDLPEYLLLGGKQEDLQMVAGADEVLDKYAESDA